MPKRSTKSTVALPAVDVHRAVDESYATISLYHPKGNILTAEIIERLRAEIANLHNQRSLKFVMIEGRGRDFSFGTSIPEHAPGVIDRVLPQMHALVRELLDVPAVTAAIVRGRCLGGGFELALACDLVFASDNALLGLPEIALGVFPPAATVLLPGRVGATRAARAILTGEPRPAAEWRAAGLVELVVPTTRLPAEVERWYNRHLASRSASSLRFAVRATRLPFRSRVQQLLPQAEHLYLNELMKTRDAREGIMAFLEKRPPRWSDE